MDSLSVKNHRRNKNPNYKNIPDDCLYLIFEKLSKKSDQDSFGLSCHQFLDVQNSCRKRLGIIPLSDLLDNVDATFILDKLLNRYRQLESLCFSGCAQLLDSCLTKLTIYGSKLRSLDLSFSCNITDKGLASVASGCPLLSVVSLYKCDSLTDDGLNILTDHSCKYLIQLDLGYCSNITDIGIGYINRRCRQLKALRISGCGKILGRTFESFSPSLNFLDAKHCGFDSSGITCIVSGGGLNYLNLCNPCWRGELGVVGLGFGANIKILDFSGCNNIEDDVITIISQGCPLLQEWNLSDCHRIDTPGWESIGLYCKNLVTLDVRGCRRFGYIDFVALTNGCTRISVLYMTDINHLIRSAAAQAAAAQMVVEVEAAMADAEEAAREAEAAEADAEAVQAFADAAMKTLKGRTTQRLMIHA